MAKQRSSRELLRQTAIHPLGRLTLAGRVIQERVSGPMPMRFWDTFAVVYVLEGRATFHDQAGLRLPLRPGALLLVFPGHGYHYDADPRYPWSEFALHFQGPVFDLWRQLKILDPARPLYHLRPIERWLERFEALVQPRPRRSGDLLRQVCRWQELLAEIVTERGSRKQDRPSSLWLAQARALLDRQPLAAAVDWQAIAAAMGLSYDRFRKRFAEAAGTSPARYVMARRLEAACRLLEDRRLGLKAVARACGFCDAFQFSKQFKKGLRLTPTEYRQFKLRGP